MPCHVLTVATGVVLVSCAATATPAITIVAAPIAIHGFPALTARRPDRTANSTEEERRKAQPEARSGIGDSQVLSERRDVDVHGDEMAQLPDANRRGPERAPRVDIAEQHEPYDGQRRKDPDQPDRRGDHRVQCG
jgi:hypothetical protein